MDHSMMKLGCLPSKKDPRTIPLKAVLKVPEIPDAPTEQDWATKFDPVPMFRNDEVGCCTCAAKGHIICKDAIYTGSGKMVAEGDVIAAYSKLTGYDPKDPTTDTGASILDSLKFWRNEGIGGHKIHSFLSVDIKRDLREVRYALALFGSLDGGVNLPLSAQTQDYWDSKIGLKYAPGTWGRHDMSLHAYNKKDFTGATWGGLKEMSTAFLLRYFEELYVVLTDDWLEANGNTPGGIDLAALENALKIIGAA